LWADEFSTNNVCPVGYRLPTAGADGENMEWEVEVDSWNEDNAHGNTKYADALASALKLPTMSGFRYSTNGAEILTPKNSLSHGKIYY
jgi:hypothetical protein